MNSHEKLITHTFTQLLGHYYHITQKTNKTIVQPATAMYKNKQPRITGTGDDKQRLCFHFIFANLCEIFHDIQIKTQSTTCIE